ncbi:MAG: PHP domain-containing protein [Deltaproteobacteria bacterium]|nr:PHP domain-containing protein [Deltaproteobacteria bacterium]
MRYVWILCLPAIGVTGCKRESCVGQDRTCELGPVCPNLEPVCGPTGRSPGFTRARRLTAAEISVGPDALGAVGDFALENDRVRAVVDAIDHPHHLAAHGGALIDLELPGIAEDGLNVVLQATGLLPKDAVTYTSAWIVESRGASAIELRGHLDGDEEESVATRYEIRPCESGIRVKTEIVNLGKDPEVWTVTDGWFWGARSLEPFVPKPDRGFVHPSFGLTDIDSVFTDSDFVAATPEVSDAASYAIVACDRTQLSGFHSDKVSAVGSPRRIVMPGDRVVLERFIAVAPGGRSIAPAVDLALDARGKLFDERLRTVTGLLLRADGAPASLVTGTVRISEIGEDGRTPWTHVRPDSDGRFIASVPSGKALVAEAQAFGKTLSEVPIPAGENAFDLGTLTLPAAARVDLRVLVDDVEDHALAFFVPADEDTEAQGSKLFGAVSTRCAPLLGPPNGPSPACNRVLVRGLTSVVVPPGKYRVLATGGPFATIDESELAVSSGETSVVELSIQRLALGARPFLSADFHVHGARSFDSSIPDRDRVASFLAADLDVLIATDHDVVTDYSESLRALDGQDQLRLISGVETTALVLFDLVKDEAVPKVIGHYNFWPVQVDPTGPWRGSLFDERMEPGALFEEFRSSKIGAAGVIQLNHPYAEAEFGRDLGFPKAIGLDARRPLDEDAEDKRQLTRAPPGRSVSNLAYDAQEVMNGSDNGALQAYRAFWFYLLNEGVVRAGTGNSDSHGLTDNLVGTPRTLVWTATSKESFDLFAFNAAVKAGQMIGTNGPIIEAVISSPTSSRTPSLQAFIPDPNAQLSITVSAAPWVPIDEVRVIVNGSVARLLTSELTHPVDPLGREGLVRYSGSIPLSSILPSAGDAWIVVEAGSAIPMAGDLDCDGIPDTGDNDGNAVVDWRDADDNDDEPDPCEGDTGPLATAPHPRDAGDPLSKFQAVTPRSYPFGFTNPFIIDRNGDGFEGASR